MQLIKKFIDVRKKETELNRFCCWKEEEHCAYEKGMISMWALGFVVNHKKKDFNCK